MSGEIPDWVKGACRAWGNAKRRLWRGAAWHLTVSGTRHWHIDGYAESFMGHLMEDKMGATQGKRSQYWPEVFGGDALDVQRVIPGMPEAPNNVLHLHYVFDPEFGLTVRAKAKLIGLKERAYWDALGRAEFWVFARLDSAHTQVHELVTEVVTQALQTPKQEGTKAQSGRSALQPRLNISALNRPILKLTRPP